MVVSNLRCLVPAGDVCGEGAVWSAAEGAIYWTDINRFLIHRHELATGNTRSWFFAEPVVALMLTRTPGVILAALASRLILFEPLTDRRRDHGFRLEGFPRVRFNDGRPDPNGAIWIGSMKNNVLANGEAGEVGKGEGKLFRVMPDGTASVWRDNLGISNTLVWSPDRRTFYFADTLEDEIRAYDFDAAKSAISNERPFLSKFGRGWPDGSSIDSEGHVWNCRYDGACIVRVAPSGAIDRVIEMPVQNITTCTFGGPDLKTLFITTARAGAPAGNRLAGGLYALDVGVPGLPETVAAL